MALFPWLLFVGGRISLALLRSLLVFWSPTRREKKISWSRWNDWNELYKKGKKKLEEEGKQLEDQGKI